MPKTSSKQRKVRVLIADDFYHERAGIRAALDFFDWIKIVGEADSAQKAVDRALKGEVDAVIMDLDWHRTKTPGLVAIQEIKKKRPEVRIVVLTQYSEFTEEAIRAGAEIAVDKRSFNNADFLAERIKEALQMEPRSPTQPVLEEFNLTEREIEVLKRMCRGLSDRQIASELVLAEDTIGTHRGKIFDKLKVSNAPAACTVATIKGIIKQEDLESNSC